MSKYTEILNVDSEEMANIAMSYTGYAEALRKQDNRANNFLIANSYLIGAVFHTLTNVKTARKNFALASEMLKLSNSPLWRISQICSQTPFDYQNYLVEFDAIDKEELFFIILQNLNLQGQKYYFQSDEFISRFFKYNLSGRIPRLGIPYILVQRAIEDIGRLKNQQSGTPYNLYFLISQISELSESYGRYGEERRYPLEPILPFEPIALAICVVIASIWFGIFNNRELVKVASSLVGEQDIIWNIAFDLIDARH